MEVEKDRGKIKAVDHLGGMESYLLFIFKFVLKTVLRFLKDKIDCCKWIAAPSHSFAIHNLVLKVQRFV